MPLTVAAINAIQDWFHRGESAPTLPSSWYYALLSAIPDIGNPNGVEITAGGVTRQGRARNTTLWSGTQAPGSTGASTGTTTPGVVSNNNTVTFVAEATAAVTGAVAVGLFDASSGGNLWEWVYIRSGGTPVTRNWAEDDEIAIAPGDIEFEVS